MTAKPGAKNSKRKTVMLQFVLFFANNLMQDELFLVDCL